MLLSSFIILAIIFNLDTFHQIDALEHNCYLKTENGKSGGGSGNPYFWKLIWAEEFNGDLLNEDLWEVEHEVDTCHGNYIKQASCNNRANAHLTTSGYLQLDARHTPMLNLNYTSATVTSRIAFTYGRLEVRAALPLGRQLRTTFFTVNSNDSAWHDHGQVVVSLQRGNIDRRVFFAGSRRNEDVSGLTEPQSKFTERLHDFHRYGWEWDQTGLRFFFDDIFTEPFSFNETATLSPWQKLRLQLGVGLALFDLPLPESFELLDWQCPALLIDYVRVFQRVRNIVKLHPCQPEIRSKRRERETVTAICEKAVKEMNTFGGNSAAEKSGGLLLVVGGVPLLLILGILLLGLLFLLTVGYILHQLRKVKAKVKEETIKLEESRQLEMAYRSTLHELQNSVSESGILAGYDNAAYNHFGDGGDDNLYEFTEHFGWGTVAGDGGSLGSSRSKTVTKSDSLKSNEYVPIRGINRQ